MKTSNYILPNNMCSKHSIPPKYNLIEKCYRSKLGIIAYANYTSLASCQRLGIDKRGLAINWYPPEEQPVQSVQHSCEILKCAETESGLSLENDTRFDYYSLYGRPLPNINSTCVPGLGMFFLHTIQQNFTDSQRVCKNMSGVMADVTTEQRTEALAQLLTGLSVESAFVGLLRKNTSSFSGTDGLSLDCFTYRAWAPGHPRRDFNQFDCVLITKQRTWHATSCKKKYPALCELIPGGPYKRRSIFEYRRRSEHPGK
ncbi:hypothetical protein K1T71_002301 [Dendrolimus kikuchii]|uniref:Uncharacterized protein n=1 Tax=Dendrolimus kikuchii TaxID=765133 RepID=A0ACC1DC87_9NEOP|nr:hypothetical protein K1T71_002301 [Dendrolimus kikuchii]